MRRLELPLFPEAASTIAGDVDALFFFLVAVSLFFGISVATLLIYFAVRYRRRSEGEIGGRVHGSMMLEIAWFSIPLLIALFIFAWGAQIYVAMARPPDDAHEIFVVGKQWMWKMQHLEGRREINELHVPVGQPVKLTMTSEDVIHSFYVPAFRVKADAVPGRYNTLWFEATKVGSYHLFCAEYCGTEHAQMGGKIVVMEPIDFQEWLSEGSGAERAAEGAGVTQLSAAGVEASGAELFQSKGCVTCHKNAPGAFGPPLAGIYQTEAPLADGGTAVRDETYLRESILDPQAKIVAGYQPVMPTFKGQLDEESVLRLVQYIKTLEEDGAQAQAPEL